jgi:hypothetical protein
MVDTPFVKVDTPIGLKGGDDKAIADYAETVRIDPKDGSNRIHAWQSFPAPARPIALCDWKTTTLPFHPDPITPHRGVFYLLSRFV